MGWGGGHDLPAPALRGHARRQAAELGGGRRAPRRAQRDGCVPGILLRLRPCRRRTRAASPRLAALVAIRRRPPVCSATPAGPDHRRKPMNVVVLVVAVAMAVMGIAAL